MLSKKIFIQKFKDNLTAIVLGYLTRKYKRNYPIDETCIECNHKISGIIHRKEKLENNFYLIIFDSYNSIDNKGTTSISLKPISTSILIHNRYYCYRCSKKLGHSNECPICLETITNNISTKCNHNFCLKCIIKWIQSDNKENVLFQAKCPICKSII